MTQVVLDAALRSKLHDLRQPLELCDESGKVLAVVEPVLDPSEYECIVPELTEEELERCRQGPDFSTQEVLAHLEKL